MSVDVLRRFVDDIHRLIGGHSDEQAVEQLTDWTVQGNRSADKQQAMLSNVGRRLKSNATEPTALSVEASLQPAISETVG